MNAKPCASISFQQQYAFLAVAFGLTDEQARATPTVSALSIGGLIKHATGRAAQLDGPGRRRARRRPPTTGRSRSAPPSTPTSS